MAAPPERSRPLHNFALPDHLKWNNNRLSQCMKVSNRRSSAPETQSNGVNRKQGKEVINRRSLNANQSSMILPSKLIGCYAVRSANSDQDRNKDGIEAVREKLMLDLRVAADKMKVSMLDNSNSTKPWNLRTRRAACTAPNGLGGGKKPVSCNSSLPAAASSSLKQKERARFSISLTREEIERDLIVMTGMKPPRRPKRRPKAVQRHLATLVPGAWLTEITPEIYKVPDLPEPGKV